MPRADKNSTLARQWELLKELPRRRPGVTARVLQEKLQAAGHPVSKRTVERDLVGLSHVFPLLSNERSKPYGWYWEEGASLEIPGMDLAEAVSLGLLEDILSQLVPPCFYSAIRSRFSEAQTKLDSLPGNRHASWADLVRYIPPGIPFLPPEILPGVMREVQEGLLQRLQICVEYAGASGGSVKELQLHPVALIQQGARSYLLASAFDYEKPLYYALHRMHSAVVTVKQARRPKGFDLDQFLHRGGGQFGEGRIITLKAQVTESLADILTETPLSEEQKISRRGGKAFLTAAVFDSWQLRYWILSQTPSIMVRQPLSLREDILSGLQASLEAYSNNELPG